MSLDITLIAKVRKTYDNINFVEDEETLYQVNITHNLTEMADKAGIYEALWRPHRLNPNYNIPEENHKEEWDFEDNNLAKASEIIPLLEKGLELLKKKPAYFKKFNPYNGWGSYDGLVESVEEYLSACKQHPYAIIYTCR